MESRRSYLSLLGTATAVSLSGCQDTRPHRSSSDSDGNDSGVIDDETTSDGHSDTLFVSSSIDSDDGIGTTDRPYSTIQRAIDVAQPGQTIEVLSGEYREYLRTTTGGRPSNPITLTGPADAVVRPPQSVDRGRPLMSIQHNHFYVTGLSLNGLARRGSPESVDSYSGGIDIKADPSRHEYLRDLKMMPHAIGNFKGAMISTERIRDAEIGEFRVIGPAGLQYKLTDETGYYAEIVYLGTWVGGIEDYGWDTIDETANIHIHHIDNSQGHPHAELVDAKPGTHDVLIEYCTDGGGSGFYQESPAIGVKGHDITARWNDLRGGQGAGIRMGSYHVTHPEESPADIPEAALDEGQSNSVYGNRITGFSGPAIQFHYEEGESGLQPIEGFGPDAQKAICGNTLSGSPDSEFVEPCPESIPEGDGNGHTGGKSTGN